MDSVNAKQIVVLANRNADNYINFVNDNPDFGNLDLETQQGIIKGSINDLIIENPGNLFPPNDTQVYIDPAAICIRNKNNGLNDCFEDACITVGAGLLGGLLGGGLPAIGVAVLTLAPQTAICERRVLRDYHNCMNDAGIPSIFH